MKYLRSKIFNFQSTVFAKSHKISYFVIECLFFRIIPNQQNKKQYVQNIVMRTFLFYFTFCKNCEQIKENDL